MAKNGQKWSYNSYLKVTFISEQSLGAGLSSNFLDIMLFFCLSNLLLLYTYSNIVCTLQIMIYIFFSFQRGVAPLHLASRHGHAHLIRLLLDHGADVNLPSRGGVCGLHLSSRCGHANAVELLLDKGTIHIRDHSFITSAKRWVGGGSQMLMFADAKTN